MLNPYATLLLKMRQLIFFIFLYVCISFMAKASALPYQPLAAPLPAKPGGNKVTDDWLVTLPMDAVDTSTMEWLDNAHLIYALPAANDKKTTKIELLDVQSSEHRVLTEGKTPIASPDGQWIAFSKGEGKGQQLWLMKSDGTDIKQLTHEPSGLGAYGYNFEIAWSPDSQRIALSHSIGLFQGTIDIIDAASLRAQRIISIAHSQIRAVEWFPDGQELLF
jgi:Tol biopolymer transport system component